MKNPKLTIELLTPEEKENEHWFIQFFRTQDWLKTLERDERSYARRYLRYLTNPPMRGKVNRLRAALIRAKIVSNIDANSLFVKDLQKWHRRER
jgi:hypothetical protein